MIQCGVRENFLTQQENGGIAAAHKQGLLFGVIGIIILSPDSLVLRLIHCDYYALITMRCAFIALAAGVFVAASPAHRRGIIWLPVLLYAVFFTGGASFFVLAVKNTHVANVLVILAIAPLLAAVGAQIFLGEKTAKATWAVAVVIFAGVALIFSADLGGRLVGNLFAFGAALTLAANSIIVRRWNGVSFTPALVVGGLFGAVVFAGFADWETVGVRDFWLTALNGGVIMTASFMLIIAAAKRMPPAEVNLLFLLETVLGPLWVWMALDEVPPATTFAAGALILPALAVHAFWSLRRR